METVLIVMSSVVITLAFVSLLRLTALTIGADLFSIRRHLNKNCAQIAPTLTVVIPAHNEEHTMFRALHSVVSSQYDKSKVTIVVVDDGSTDSTRDVVRAFQQSNPEVALTLVCQQNAGKAHALNAGIRASDSELIMCLDADSALHPRALRNAAHHFTDRRIVAISSNVQIIARPSLLNILQRVEYILSQRQKRAHAFFNIEYIIGGIGSTFRRSTLEKVGLYDTNTMTEDIDLTMKLLRLGNKQSIIGYGENVVTYTESAHSLGDLIKQRFRWKFGRMQTFYKNTDIFFSLRRDTSIMLTWFYMPYALVGDLMLFLEPLVVTFLLFDAWYWKDWSAFLGAIIVIGVYTALNVFGEDTYTLKERLLLAALSPIMYILFYILSFVEYVALLRTYAHAHRIPLSISENSCSWEHVERAPRALSV